MKCNSLVTVIIPAFNEERFLNQAVESIIQQTYPHWELLIINDGSTDKTEEIAREYVSRDDRIKYYSYGINRGLSFARNYGTRKAKGKYICVFGADDIAYPKMLEVQVMQLEKNPKCIHVQGSFDYIDERGNIIGHFNNRYKTDLEIKAYELFGNCISDGGSLLRKEVLDSTGLEADLKARCSQDYLLWLRLLPHGEFMCIDEPTFKYRINYESKTKKFMSDNPVWYDDLMKQIFQYAWESRGFTLEKNDISFIYHHIYLKKLLWRLHDVIFFIALYRKIKNEAEDMKLPERKLILYFYRTECAVIYSVVIGKARNIIGRLLGFK